MPPPPSPPPPTPPPPTPPPPSLPPAPPFAPPPGCGETCNYSADGDCDDGGPGSEFVSCAFASDCNDCGIRAVVDPPPSPPSSPPTPPSPPVPSVPPSAPPCPPLLPPPPPSPVIPGAAYKPVITMAFTLAGDVASFDKAAFRASLLAYFQSSASVEDVEVTIEAGSVIVTTRVIMSSGADAATVSSSLRTTPVANLSAALNITIEDAAEPVVANEIVEAPLPPAPPRPPAQPPFPPGVFLITSDADVRSALETASALNLLSYTLILPPGARVAVGVIPVPFNRTMLIESGGEGATLDAGDSSRLFEVRGHLHVRGVTLANGRAQHGGGMIVYGGASATLEQVLIANCTAHAADYGSADGGAIYVDPSASVVVRDSVISNCVTLNEAAGAGGAGGAARGGGVYVLGRLELISTRVSGCRAQSLRAVNKGNGGAVFVADGVLLLSNVTSLVDNSASGQGKTFFGMGGVSTYSLPAPPGHWIAGLECKVYRRPCEQDAKGNVLNQTCEDTADECSMASACLFSSE